MQKFMIAAIAALAGFVSPTQSMAQDGDAAAGKDVFRKCAACHRVGPEAKNAVGPVLNGVIGRPAGTAPSFAYSQLNQSAGKSGLVWTEALVFEYLVDPSAFLKKFLTEKGHADQATGATKMVFKLPDETERRNVIAYLREFSPDAKK